MKYSLFCLTLAAFILLSACNKPECDPSLDEFVGDEFFTVEYLDASDNSINYLEDVYNLGNVVVYLDTAGGSDPSPQYELIEPGYKDGKFGPFNYTDRYVNQARNEINSVLLYGNTFRFDYYFHKDTYGDDILTVEFVLGVNNCNTYWQNISYYLNGTLLPEYQNQQQPQIVIKE